MNEFDGTGIYEMKAESGERFHCWYDYAYELDDDMDVFVSAERLDNGFEDVAFGGVEDAVNYLRSMDYTDGYDLCRFVRESPNWTRLDNADQSLVYVGDDFWGELNLYDMEEGE